MANTLKLRRKGAVGFIDWLDGLALINMVRFLRNINRRRIFQVASGSQTVLLQKVRNPRQTRDRGRMEWYVADPNPARIDPAHDIIATALGDLLLAEVGIMQTHKLENFPQAMRVFRQIAEEVGFKRIEWCHHLTSLVLEGSRSGVMPEILPDAGRLNNPKLLDQVRAVSRLKHYSVRTEQAYTDWIRRFIVFHSKRNSGVWRHPREMTKAEVSEFLTYLADDQNVAASTQNQALSALLFLYKEVLKQQIGWIDQVERASKPRRVPVVLSRREVNRIFAHLHGTPKLMAALLYGSGLRLMECVRLRVKDVDFAYAQITVRDAKGGRDRVTMLPVNLVEPLQRHLLKVKTQHEQDIEDGFGTGPTPLRLGTEISQRQSRMGVAICLSIVPLDVRILVAEKSSDITWRKAFCSSH